MSLDFNGNGGNAAIISPRFLLGSLTAMKSGSVASSRSKTGSFPSPGTPPSYRYQKGWSSERVPLPANSSRRYMAGGAVLPFNNGRAIPSKWEDAEKWIFSPPVGSENAGRSSVPLPHHRRPKSKSGPLGPPAYMSSSSAASPLNPCFDSGRVGGFNGSSPFLATVFTADRGSCGSASSGRGGGVGGGGGGGGRSSSANAEPYILRSASVHEWSDTMVESSLPSLRGTVQEEKITANREAGTSLVLRKDVATQMSPGGSSQSSPKERRSFSQSPSAHPIEELENHFSKLEVRDVQVDDRVTVTRWSKKHVARGSDRRSMNIIEWKKKIVEAKTDSSAGWEVAETSKCISKYKREEAKITAWENLQKAKAEAAIRKLEMKLEKKRSSSMDKILNKLRSAQRKAQDMRSAVDTIQSQQVVQGTPRRISYFRRNGQISSLSGCFTCPAF